MDEDSSQATLSSMMERLSRLENDVRELRQLVLLQKPYVAESVPRLSPIPANSDVPEPAAAGLILGKSHAWADSVSVLPVVILAPVVAVEVNPFSSTCWAALDMQPRLGRWSSASGRRGTPRRGRVVSRSLSTL